jgi:hypothetical protein
VPWIREADVGKRPLAALARHHEREHAGEIGAKRHRGQVEHQGRVLDEGIRDAERLVAELHLHALLPFGALDPLFDLAHVVEIVRHAGPVGGAEPRAQRPRLGGNRVEQALVLGQDAAPLRLRRAVAEEPLEGDARD